MILIDPHLTSFIYYPLSYYLKGITKVPNKYEYLDISLRVKGNINFYFSSSKSSVPKFRFFVKYAPRLARLISFVEKLFWIKLNKIQNITVSKELSGDIFFFGHRYLNWEMVNSLARNININNIYIHLSHYHTFPSKIDKFDKKIIFCSDFNIKNNDYFISKFPLYNQNIIEVPFCVQDRFFAKPINYQKVNPIAIVGTFVLYPIDYILEIYTNDKSFQTIHPIRYELSRFKFGKHVIYKQYEFINSFRRHIKNYYSNFDIVDLMDKTSCIVCGSEGNGLLGISTLEALAMGNNIFITEDEMKILGITKIFGINFYKDLEDLICKIELYNLQNDINLNREKLRQFALKYSKSHLIRSTQKLFKLNNK